MTKEDFLTELEKELIVKNEFKIVEFFLDKLGILLTGVSLIAALMVYGSKVVCRLLLMVDCRFWNIDERVIGENSYSYIDLGIYLLFFILVLISQSLIKRYFDLFFLNSCKIYIIDKETMIVKQKHRRELYGLRLEYISLRIKQVFSKKENIKDNNKIDQIKNTIDSILVNNKNFNECLSILVKPKLIVKKRYRWDLVIGILISLLASFFITASIGFDFGNAGIKSMFYSMILMILSICGTTLLQCWLEIYARFKSIYNYYVKNRENEFDTDLFVEILYIIQDRIEYTRDKGLKRYVSDKVCINTLRNFICLAIISLLILPIIRGINLINLDNIYVVNDGCNDYAVVYFNEHDYIMEQCDILNDCITVYSRDVLITKNPIKMKKVEFSKLQRIQ